MKKLYTLTISTLVLFCVVACKNGNTTITNEPETTKKVTIKAGFDFNLSGSGVSARMITPSDYDDTKDYGDDIHMKWEEGDVVELSSKDPYEEPKVFTLKPGTITFDEQKRCFAEFEGEPLADMTSYNVTYRGWPSTIEKYSEDVDVQTFTIAPEIFKPYGEGNQRKDGSFIILHFGSVIQLQLKGNCKLGQILYLAEVVGVEDPDMLRYRFEGGYLQLTDTPVNVYLPTTMFGANSGLSISFYDENDNLIITKQSGSGFTFSPKDEIFLFPVLDIQK